jgi:glycosyltransferase involved in cell wall biosynthesis
MSSTVHLSVVIPAYKCADCIPELYRRLTATLVSLKVSYEIVLVDDRSPHDDWLRIRELCSQDPHVRGFKLSRNYGQHFAITAGLDHVRGDWIVVMDGDLQDQPEEIPKLYAKAMEGWEVVVARRANRQDSLYRRTVSRAFACVYGWLGDITVDPTIANFSICSRNVIAGVCQFRERNRSFPLFLEEAGFPRCTIDVNHAPRFSGKSSYTLFRLFDNAVQSIVSRSNKPLRLSIRFGFLLAFLALALGTILIYRYYTHKVSVEGWTSIAVLITFLGGLGFANLGILGLYLGKVFNETKRRPLYLIERTLNSDEEGLQANAPHETA